MNVLIQIHYITRDNKILRRGNFPLKGKSIEDTALDFWKWIKREHPYECEIEKIICDGEDYTEKVKELEKKKLKDLSNDYCP